MSLYFTCWRERADEGKREGEEGERQRKEEREPQRQMGDEHGLGPAIRISPPLLLLTTIVPLLPFASRSSYFPRSYCCLARVFLLPKYGCMIWPIIASPFYSLLRLRFACQARNTQEKLGLGQWWRRQTPGRILRCRLLSPALYGNEAKSMKKIEQVVCHRARSLPSIGVTAPGYLQRKARITRLNISQDPPNYRHKLLPRYYKCG
ncbi:uncharacterized protein LOC119308636 isoform X2 [Triticum dicoccoides]|uniref:uncharacterized protein LOC119308636 isoform X2 n=1 Tax=Triticum dicoccoides TaxID=85692 RepID=UPI00188F14EB|nr:uncharacterized protein LOC119308636 isoform X2 [Triticum dicoccoides]